MEEPVWLSNYLCGISAESCSSWHDIDIKKIRSYLSKNSLRYKCGVIAWEDRYKEGKNVGEIAQMYGSNYSTVRNELEQRGYQVNDEETWLFLLKGGKTLTHIAEEYLH